MFMQACRKYLRTPQQQETKNSVTHPSPATYSPAVTKSLLLKVTVRESKPHQGLSYPPIAPIFPFPLSLQPVRGSISSVSKGGTAAETPFFLQKHPSVAPTAPIPCGPASGIMTPRGPELHRVAAEAGTLHIPSPALQRWGYSWENTHLKEGKCISRCNSYRGEIMASCVVLTSVSCFSLSLTKKGNTGPQILSCFSLTQDNLDFNFHENVFKGAGVIQLLNLTRNIVSCS